MQHRPTRHELDHLAKIHALDQKGVDAMLDLADARPGHDETRRFLDRCLRIGGVLSIAAGVVFFVAANWSAFAVFGRFALIELILVVCAAVGFWKPPPAFPGRAALFLAFIATGALLALFGQTYQTGADVHELFFTWALLGLPFVIVAQWSVASAGWVVVLNVALMLFAGMLTSGGLFGVRLTPTHVLMGASWLNLALWFVAEWYRPMTVPAWVRRLIVTATMWFATRAGLLAVFAEDLYRSAEAPSQALAVIALLLAWGAPVAYALKRREDVYPLALVMASFTIVSMAWLIKFMRASDAGAFLLLALYLIGVSTVGGRVLLVLYRRWREEAHA